MHTNTAYMCVLWCGHRGHNEGGREGVRGDDEGGRGQGRRSSSIGGHDGVMGLGPGYNGRVDGIALGGAGATADIDPGTGGSNVVDAALNTVKVSMTEDVAELGLDADVTIMKVSVVAVVEKSLDQAMDALLLVSLIPASSTPARPPCPSLLLLDMLLPGVLNDVVNSMTVTEVLA
ncbi:hypothetical protein V7S43_014290 [Phytophthora oleae]|uniref:Uncharacterized protein n=1 Tax=Phytophthora oleae TaxID=2107226 RepID=A0ABD3F521_9STRA